MRERGFIELAFYAPPSLLPSALRTICSSLALIGQFHIVLFYMPDVRRSIAHISRKYVIPQAAITSACAIGEATTDKQALPTVTNIKR